MGGKSSSPATNVTSRVKIILLGSAQVGKTALCVYQERGMLLSDRDTLPECQLFQYPETLHGLRLHVILMDSLSDQDIEAQVPCRLKCIQNTDCAVLVFDLSQSDGLAKVQAKLKALEANGYMGKEVVLVGNKGDLERKVEEAEINALLQEERKILVTYFTTSCLNGENVKSAFTHALQISLRSKRLLWELRKPLVFLYDQLRHSEVAPAPTAAGFASGLCEALPNLFTRKRLKKGPKLDQLPATLVLRVLHFLF